MPQTLLATCALVCTLLLAQTRFQERVHEDLKVLRGEIETAMANVATNWIEEAASVAFDEATRNGPVTSAAALTAPTVLGKESAGFNDVDDYITPDEINNQLEMVSGVIHFRVRTRVFYINPVTRDSSGVATSMKRIVAVVNRAVPMPTSVTLSQDVACGTRCKGF